MRPTVLIVDDHDGFRKSARALLEAEGFDVVGDAADGAAAVTAVSRLRPIRQRSASFVLAGTRWCDAMRDQPRDWGSNAAYFI